MQKQNDSKFSAITPHRDAIIRLMDQETEERVDRIEKEFKAGFKIVNKYSYTVTVFGSARFLEDNIYYSKARETGAMLASEGFAVITGGGGGIMEAANRGAYEAGGRSIGFNITLPNEQNLNAYTNESLAFRYFFARKVMLAYAASALICFPGGFGTLDEMFEILTLIQTAKMPPVPIILFGSEFWSPLDEFIKKQLLHTNGAISHGDEELYTVTDNVETVKQIVNQYRETSSVFNMPVETTV
ncbi:MAG: TIGR00730 family Rossman fold protein [bacterium]|nr:TIGR00730 family Rossman fold protein [bacterium]